MNELTAKTLAKPARQKFVRPLLAILGLALLLRVWGSSYGLPYELTIDETHEVMRAFKLGIGEWKGGLGKGGLHYLLFVEYGAIYVFWWLMGWVANTHEFALAMITDRTVSFLAGRLTVALMGTLTCLVVFLIAKRVYGSNLIGLSAALIGAAAYQHAYFCHEINVDIGMVLALWSSLLAYLEYERTEKLRWLAAAGSLAAVAIVFKMTGAIALPALFLAIVSRREAWRKTSRVMKEGVIVALAALLTLTVVVPDVWGRNIFTLYQSAFLSQDTQATVEGTTKLTQESNQLTWIRYVQYLWQPHNLPLFLMAMLGAGIGFACRHRWDIVWALLILVYLGTMTLTEMRHHPDAVERSTPLPPEHYILPIVPGLWLLSSRAIVAISGKRRWLTGMGITFVIALPLFLLVRQNHEWTQPDTRIVAKDWIEAHVPSGSRILMDGMRYRFSLSPPLNSDPETVRRRVAKAGEEGHSLSRGVSSRTLALYTEAMTRLRGPKYEIYSTNWGRDVQDIEYYVQQSFDYIVTSSFFTERYASREFDRKRFPKSVTFYERLDKDPRLKKVYSVGPVPWQSTGPAINVYRVLRDRTSEFRNAEVELPIAESEALIRLGQ